MTYGFSADKIEIYEKYRGWFVGGVGGFQSDRGLTVLLSRGMKAWFDSDCFRPKQICSRLTMNERPKLPTNELVGLLASLIGGC